MKGILSAFLVPLLMLAFPAAAADYYVSPLGDDATGQGSSAKPWRTLTKAVDAAASGDTVWVASDGNPATVDYPSTSTVVAQSKLTIARTGSGNDYPQVQALKGAPAITLAGAGSVVRGIEFSGAYPSMGVELGNISNGGKIEQCRFVANGAEVLWRAINVLEGASEHTVSDCLFDQQSYGLWVEGKEKWTSALLVEGCSFNLVTEGIYLTMGVGNAISGNQFIDPSKGLNIDQSDDNIIVGNSFTKASLAGIMVSSSLGTRVEDNLFSQCGTGFLGAGISRTGLLSNSFEKCATACEVDGGKATTLIGNTVAGPGTHAFKFNGNTLFARNNHASQVQTAFQLIGTKGLLLFNEVYATGVPLVSSGEGRIFLANSFGPDNGAASGSGDWWDSLVTLSYHYQQQSFKGLVGNFHGSYTGVDDGSDGGVAGDGIGDGQLPVVMTASGDSYPLVGAPAQYQLDFWQPGPDGLLLSSDAVPDDWPDVALPPKSGSWVFATSGQAQGHVIFGPGDPAAETAWSYTLSHGAVGTDGLIGLELGWADGQGNSWFDPLGPTVTFGKEATNSVRQSGYFPARPLVVPTGKRLALRLTNTTKIFYSLDLLTSYLSPPGPAADPFPAGGQTPERLTVTPPELTLGEVEFGQSYPLSLTVANGGGPPLLLSEVTTIGPQGAELTVTGGSCVAALPVTLADGESCKLELLFAPVAGGERLAGLLLASDDPGTPYYYVHLAAQAGPQYQITTTIDPPTAGTVKGGGISCPKLCSLMVDKGTVVKLVATPEVNANFEKWSGCDQVNGEECSLTVNAAKAVTAHFAAKLPQIGVNPTQYDFGHLFTGEKSSPVAFEIGNQGDWELTVTKLEVAGPDDAEFAVTDNGCDQPVAPGQSCTFGIVYAPTIAGDKQAELVVTSDDPDLPELSIPLLGSATTKPRKLSVLILPGGGGTVAGEGIACPGDCEETFDNTVQIKLQATPADGYKYISFSGCDQVVGNECAITLTDDRVVSANFARCNPAVEVTPVLLDFGDIAVGSSSAPLQIEVANNGDWPLNLGQSAISGLFADDFSLGDDSCSNSSLAPAGKCQIAALFTPGERLLRGATLTIASNDLLAPAIAVALVGTGLDDVGTPELPPQPLSGNPVLRAIPGSLNFGQQGFDDRGHQKMTICNLGGGQALFAGVTIEGGDAASFSAEDPSPEGTAILFGQCISANLFFLPHSDGPRSALALFAFQPPVATVAVPIYGTGGSYQPPEVASAKAEGGCSAATIDGGKSAGIGGALLLLLLVALLWAGSAIGRLRYLSLTLCLIIGTGTTAPQLAGCDANAAGTCLGSFELTGTGMFETITTTFRFMLMATNLTTGCSETQFTIIEDVPGGGYVNSEYFSVSLYLPSPLFPGRRYGQGTEVMVNLRGNLFPTTCYIADGEVEVADLLLREKPEACNAFIELRFDIESLVCDHGRVAWEALPQLANPSALKGWGQFSYGAVPEECNPPSVEDVGDGILHGKTGQHIFRSGEEDPRKSAELPVLYWGTEVNLATVTHTVREEVQEDGSQVSSQEVPVTIEPPPQKVGNWLCPCPDSYPALNDLRCPDDAHPAQFETALAPPGFPDLVAPLCDRFGVKPILVADWEPGPPSPAILAPLGRQDHYQGDPLVLKWLAQPDFGDGTVIIRGFHSSPGAAAGDQPLFEFATADTGSLTLDPAMLAKLSTEALLEVERSHLFTPQFSIPLREGSSVLMRKIGAVVIYLKEGSSITFPDPEQPLAGWTPREEIGKANTDYWAAGSPVVEAGPDGLLHVAWMGFPNYRIFDSNALTWVEPQAASSGLHINNGPLGLKAGPGGELLMWGLEKKLNQSEYRPVAYKWTDKLTGGLIEGADFHTKHWPFAATLLADGRPVVTWTNDDKMVHWSIDLAPFELLGEGLPAVWAPSRIFPRSDGKVALLPSGNSNTIYLADPDGQSPPEPLTVSTGLGFCPDTAALDWQDTLHFVCRNDKQSYRPDHFSVSLSGGQLADPTTAVTEDPALLDRYLYHKLVFGQDGSLWLLWVISCESGGCPLLFRRSSAGKWLGPYFGGQAVGTVDLAVDPAGRLHLVSMPAPIEMGVQGTVVPVYHTMTEVAP